MRKTVKRIRRNSIIIVTIELLALTTFLIFWFCDFSGIQSKIPSMYIVVGASILVVLNIFVIWISIIFFVNRKQKNELTAADILGNDVKDAYEFGMIGLLVTNEDNVVIWANDLFIDRQINIVDENIFEWKPELRKLKEGNVPNGYISISDENKTYSVKYIKNAGLYIFKDTTQYTDLYDYSQKHIPVVGLLSIDNYNDVVKTEDDLNDSVTKVKNVIFAYAKKHKILVRRYRNDTYFLLLNYEILTGMKEDDFSLIKDARESCKGDIIPLTLSLGLAYDVPDIIDINQMAEEALSIALSRGGDQVVVNRYGNDMEFYGGKTETMEKRNRVKVRVVADSLIALIKNATNVIIMGHAQLDMDALGACLGVKTICDRFRKNSKIVIDIKNTELKTKGALLSEFSKDELSDLIVTGKEASQVVNQNTLLIIVDVHIPRMTMNPDLLDKTKHIVVIDHHRRAEEYIESPVLNYIDSGASSTSEIITQFISFASVNPKIQISHKVATIMLSGIYLDSGYFKSQSAGIHAFEAATTLKDFGADNVKADNFLKDEYEDFVTINRIVSNIKTAYSGVVYTIIDDEEYDQVTLAKAANTCLSFKGVNAVFIIGKTGNKEMRLSARSDGTINVQLLAEKLGGGGHFAAAAAIFDNVDAEEIESRLIKVLDTYLSEARKEEEENK